MVLRSYALMVLKNWKENLYLISLGAFLVALPTSIALISITSVALLVVWFLTGDYKTKWNRLLQNKSALLIMSIPIVYLIGLCFTNNTPSGLQELNKSLPWLIFAFVLGSSAPISYKATWRLLGVFIFAVSLAAGVALIKLSLLDTIFNFRKAAWVDHIPFSYQTAFAIWLLLYFIFQKNCSAIQKTLLSLLIATLLIALLSLKSLNAFLYFGVMTFTALILLALKTKKRSIRLAYIFGIVLITVLPVYYVYTCVQKFYTKTEYNENEIDEFTANGNKYVHDFNSKFKENGNYIYLYICEKELIPLWNAHSKKQYTDVAPDGDTYGALVLRYMTSKGLRKDSAGFAQLSQKDIENIEKEIPNYIFAGSKFSIYPRIYETIWEIDRYIITKNPNNKSLAERIEQAILAIDIIKKHIWVGIGLGNNAKAYNDVILETGSKLEPQKTGWAHNQYLNYLIRFGVLGTLFILGVITYVFVKGRKNNPFLLTLFFVSMLVANFGEANWETFIGLNYFAFFFCFLMWITPKEIKEL